MAQRQMTPQEAAQQNLFGRSVLLSQGISMIKRLQPVQGALGSTIRIPLLRMGVMTGVLLQFTVPVTIATDPAVMGANAPFNIARMVTYTDFAGVNRTKTSGFGLWMAQCFKQGDLLGAIPSMASAPAGTNAPDFNYDKDILNIPTAVGDGEIKFSIFVPMAYDAANDLTGAVLTQTNVGEHYITVDLASVLSSSDEFASPYKSGAVTMNGNVTVEAFQHYIQPQSMDASMLPILDLSTIYGFEGGYQTTANIAAGQDTFINLPNNRSIFSSLIQYQEGGTFAAGSENLDSITLLANSNTNFREMTPRMLREVMRNMINSDAPLGTYLIASRRQPIMTQLYANVQAKMAVKRANAGVTQMIAQYEVQYASGAPLPGITVAA